MKSGYIKAHADQQPYMQGFMPVIEVYLAKTVGLAPRGHRHGQWHRVAERRRFDRRDGRQGPSIRAFSRAGPIFRRFADTPGLQIKRPNPVKRALKIYLGEA